MQELGPLHHPQVDEFFSAQEVVDHGVAFAGGGVGEKRPDLIGSGQRPGDIEVDAAQKGRVVREVGRRDAQFAQLRIDEGVDVVVFRDGRPREVQILRDREDLHAGREAFVTGGDERFAA